VIDYEHLTKAIDMKKLLVLCGLGVIMVNASEHKESAFDCLIKAQDYLGNQYNYQEAVTWFLRASDLYASEPSTASARLQNAQAWIGLAMSYHNIGQTELSKSYLHKAQKLLEIPDDTEKFTDQTKFSYASSEYFVVKGYHLYMQAEQNRSSGNPVQEERYYLYQAKDAFSKSLEITNILGENTMDSSHAQHGLGTIFEFLGKNAQARHDQQQTLNCAHQAIDSFKKALAIRIQLLGTQHPNVARSHHKLARNYAILADLLHQQISPDEQKRLYDLADSHYQKALQIFDKSKIPLEQIKRKELTEEYVLFKKKYTAK
jgi:tetratricopeptide (TPR) repeat protein